MIQISEKEARKLVVSGAAGYWSIHNRTILIEHDVQTVVRLRGKWFLAPVVEFKVVFICEAGVLGGRVKGAFSVVCENEELGKMATEEMAERGVTLEAGLKAVPDKSHLWN